MPRMLRRAAVLGATAHVASQRGAAKAQAQQAAAEPAPAPAAADCSARRTGLLSPDPPPRAMTTS